MRYSEINEAPLAGMDAPNLDKEGSFSRYDRNYISKTILKNAYVEKLKNVPVDLYVYILNQKGLEDEAKKRTNDVFPLMGQVHWDIGPAVRSTNTHSSKLIKLRQLYPLRAQIDTNLKKNPSSIHLIIGDNVSDGAVPLSPWMILHRLMHTTEVVRYSDPIMKTTSILKHYRPENPAVLSWWDVPMMKSVINGDPEFFNNEDEMFLEMAVEYMYTGNIRINVDKIQQKCGGDVGKFKRTMRYINKHLDWFKTNVDNVVRNMLGTTRYI
jgi:hypothetical protein